MKLWLDDVRRPPIGFEWAKSYDEAVKLLATGQVTYASLDHDLDPMATIGETPTEKTGYDVIRWMEDNGAWPKEGLALHSMNPVGRERMFRAAYGYYDRFYKRSVPFDGGSREIFAIVCMELTEAPDANT